MDFIQNFVNIFLEKHGKTIYEQICTKIKNKAQSNYNDEYLKNVFLVALLAYWGMNDTQIANFLRDNVNIDSINVTEIKNIHKDAINEIQRYIEIANNESKK